MIGARTAGWKAWMLGLFLLTLTLGVRLWPAWNLKAEVADLSLYRAMAQVVLKGDNIYQRRVFFPYTPYSQFLPASMLKLSDYMGWRFDFTMKLPAIVADGIVSVLLCWALLAAGASLGWTLAWGLSWALNPVSILISAFHGNVMPVLACLLLGAVIAAERAESSVHRRRLLAISALVLGLGIAMRTFPVLALPIFLALAARSIRETLEFGVLAGFAAGISSLPYLIFARQTFVREILSYSGFSDFGWVAALRAMSYLTGGPLLSGFDDGLIMMTKSLFLYAYGIVLLTLPWFRRTSLALGSMLAPLLFFGLYGGLSAQYLVWMIPLAILVRDRFVLVFSVLAAICMACFYALYHPGILFGVYPPLFRGNVLISAIYALTNLIMVALSLAWTVRIVLREIWGSKGGAQSLWLLPLWPRWRWLRWLYAIGICALLAMWGGMLHADLAWASNTFVRIAPRGLHGAWTNLADFLSKSQSMR